jgi:TatD DNase family protein
MLLFDTHAHLADEQFDGDRRGVIERARAAGVAAIVTIGTSTASGASCLELAYDHPFVHAAVGIHPTESAGAAAGDWDRIVQLAQDPRVVAIGETGLDYFWDYAPLETQREYFARHLQLAQEVGKPVVIHMREPDDVDESPGACAADILRHLHNARNHGPISGVMHSYTGDAACAAQFMELGMHISFGGIVTFKKSTALREVAGVIPHDRILIETDAPYLSPHPCRSQRPNEPALLVHTAACLAEVRGMALEEFAELTTANARRLFGVG